MKPEKKVNYYKSGKVEYEGYFINGKLHRPDGPAYIGYCESGKIEFEGYYINGEHHCLGGPAVISYHKSGKVDYEWYYVNGKQLTEEQIEEVKFNKMFDKELMEIL